MMNRPTDRQKLATLDRPERGHDDCDGPVIWSWWWGKGVAMTGRCLYCKWRAWRLIK